MTWAWLSRRARAKPRLALRSVNPVWLREMRQLTRVARTPLLLSGTTLGFTLLLCALGGVTSWAAASATTGRLLYHTFFSLVFFFVALVGPALAASAIAAEREGRTWEALQLTALTPAVIARGKFLAAYTHLGLYLVMLAPVGALPFLFGGVTPWEVLLGMLDLAQIAALAVSFGLAMSSNADSPRTAIVTTLMTSFAFTPILFGVLGVGGSYVVHERWASVATGLPVWLPLARAQLPFSWAYLAILVVLPLLLLGVPAWFFYEITVANLTSSTDDRSTGLRRWFLVSSLLLLTAGSISVAWPVSSSGGLWAPRINLTLLVLALWLTYHVLCALVFVTEPFGPSRRVLRTWQKQGAGFVERAMGPGLLRAFSTQALVVCLGLVVMTLVSAFAALRDVHATGGAHRSVVVETVLLFAYPLGYASFLLGVAAWAKARLGSASAARITLIATLFVTLLGPWIVDAFAQRFFLYPHDTFLMAAPSLFYLRLVLQTLSAQGDHGSWADSLPAVAYFTCGVAWGLLGLGLLGRAARRSRQAQRLAYRDIARTDALLAQEDAQRS